MKVRFTGGYLSVFIHVKPAFLRIHGVLIRGAREMVRQKKGQCCKNKQQSPRDQIDPEQCFLHTDSTPKNSNICLLIYHTDGWFSMNIMLAPYS